MAIIRFDPWAHSLLRPWLENEDWLGFSDDSSLTSYETENDFVVQANVASPMTAV